MATISETRRGSGGLGCVGVLAIIAFLGLLLLSSIEIPDVGPVETGSHATERHGSDAELVRSELAAGGGSHYDCRDGKEYITKYLPSGPHKGKWALMVVKDGVEKTSFITDQSYLHNKLEDDGCSNGWSHP